MAASASAGCVGQGSVAVLVCADVVYNDLGDKQDYAEVLCGEDCVRAQTDTFRRAPCVGTATAVSSHLKWVCRAAALPDTEQREFVRLMSHGDFAGARALAHTQPPSPRAPAWCAALEHQALTVEMGADASAVCQPLLPIPLLQPFLHSVQSKLGGSVWALGLRLDMASEEAAAALPSVLANAVLAAAQVTRPRCASRLRAAAEPA